MSLAIVLIPLAIAAIGAMSTLTDLPSSDSIAFKTRIKNSSILQEALFNYGYEPFKTENGFKVNVENGEIIFELDEDEKYVTIFSGDFSKEEAENFILELYEEYTTLVQQHVYQKLLKNIKERNLNLESEEITENNSILLTLEVQEQKL